MEFEKIDEKASIAGHASTGPRRSKNTPKVHVLGRESSHLLLRCLVRDFWTLIYRVSDEDSEETLETSLEAARVLRLYHELVEVQRGQRGKLVYKTHVPPIVIPDIVRDSCI